MSDRGVQPEATCMLRRGKQQSAQERSWIGRRPLKWAEDHVTKHTDGKLNGWEVTKDTQREAFVQQTGQLRYLDESQFG